MSSNPLVSFVIPTYNAASYIEQAVRSCLDQTYAPVEVVIVDDGSHDNTLDILETNFGADSRVRWMSQENSGPSAARNRGIAEATGEFIHFLDADEYILPQKVEQSLDLFHEHPDAGVVYGHGIPVEADGLTVIPMNYPPLPSGDVFCEWLIGTMSGGTYGVVSSFMVRRAALDRVGGFNESMRWAEDWELWLRLAVHYHFIALSEKLVYYRRTTEGAHRNRLNMASGRLKTYQLVRDLEKRKQCLDDAAYDRLLASRWQVVAIRYWERGQGQAARKAFRQAIQLNPDKAALRRLFTWFTYFLPHTSVDLIGTISRRTKRILLSSKRS